MEKLIFKDWDGIWQVGVCALLSYAVLFIFIRISGKRTLSKLTAFDFVVSVTLCSTLSSMMLGKSPIAEGVVALLVIISLQFLLAYSAKKSKGLEEVINSKPTLLFYKGDFMEAEMERELVTEEEIYAAVRKFRLYRLDQVQAVVMEINGELTVVPVQEKGTSSHHSLMDIELHEKK